MMPFIELALLSVILSLTQNLLFKRLSDQTSLREINKEMKKIQERMKETQKNKDYKAMEKVITEMNKLNSRKMSLVMKPNLMSSAVFIFAFWWMKESYSTLIVSLPLTIPVPAWAFPPWVWTQTLGWLGWYLLNVLTSSLIIREIFEIHI